MDFAQTIFVIEIIVSVVCTALKIINIAKFTNFFDGVSTFVTSFVFYVTHSIIWLIAIIEHETLLITQLWKLEWVLFWMHSMFIVVETMIYLYKFVINKSKQTTFALPMTDIEGKTVVKNM